MSTKIKYIFFVAALCGALSAQASQDSDFLQEEFTTLFQDKRNLLQRLQEQYHYLKTVYKQEQQQALQLKYKIIHYQFISLSTALLLEEEQELLELRLNRLSDALQQVKKSYDHVKAQLSVLLKKYNNVTTNRGEDEVQNTLD